MDGLLGVAGMMTLLVMTGIIPENSLLSTSKSLCGVYLAEKKYVSIEYIIILESPDPLPVVICVV